MRRTLTFLIITSALCATAMNAQASWLSEMLFGRHDEYTYPAVNVAIDRYVPKRWWKMAGMKVRYHQENEVVFRGEKLSGTVLLNTGAKEGRDFAICITDPECAVTGGKNFRFKKDDRRDRDNYERNDPWDDNSRWERRRESEDDKTWDRSGKMLGGLNVLETFRGRAGYFRLDTALMEEGSYFLDVYVLGGGKHEKFTEKPIMLRIGPPLPDVIAGLESASDATLKQWGLEASTEEVPSATNKALPPAPPPSASNVDGQVKGSEEPELDHEQEPQVRRGVYFGGGVTVYVGRWQNGKFCRVRPPVVSKSFASQVCIGDSIRFCKCRGGAVLNTATIIGVNPKRMSITVTLKAGEQDRISECTWITCVKGGRE